MFPARARCEVADELLSLLDVLWTAALWKPSTISPCASGAAATSGFWMCPSLAAGRAPVWWEDEQVFATHRCEASASR